MGGSDQWGKITAGCELIRRKAAGNAFALTCPLLTKSDGTKFGKSEAGEKLWLDPALTSPYRFYQFWLNSADDDALRYLKVFTVKSQEEIETVRREHLAAPHKRALQKALAKDITLRVHSEAEFKTAFDASSLLFGEGTAEGLKGLSEADLLGIFEGVPKFAIAKTDLERGIPLLDLLAVSTAVFPSKGEARRMVASGGVFLNKERIADSALSITSERLLKNRYLVVQKGKKNYYLIKAE
jgi:tyrosyl-tRNA synthetase